MTLKKAFYFFFIFFGFAFSVHADVFYKVKFSGIDSSKILRSLIEHSDLSRFEKRSIPSVNALRYRIDSDLPNLMKVLHSYAYYDAKINTHIELIKEKHFVVQILIKPGVQYLLSSVDIFNASCTQQLNESIQIEDLGLKLYEPAVTKKTLDSQVLLLEKLATLSYPLATIEKKDVKVNVRDKTVSLSYCVDIGPFSKFGSVTILGLKDIDERFIERKIAWKESTPYDLNAIILTQKRLMETNLFGSVLVSHTGELDASEELPMKIRLTESKHQSFNFGVSYATIDGPGASASWEHRNIAHMGQLLNFQVDVSKIASTGIATYKIPDFYRLNQDYIWQGMVVRENVVPYLAFTYRFGNRLEWTLSDINFVSLGLKAEYIDVKDSISNGKFTFLGLPLYFRFSTASSLLDPTSGASVTYKITPYQAVSHNRTFFLKQTLKSSFYIPLNLSRRVVLALRVQLGSITGASLFKIPFTKRFLGGSDENLRGYRFKTVSPTNTTGDPLGGRSAIYSTLELRFRVTESIGVVPFTDWGTVSLKQYPDVNTKWFKSVGLGLRYFTFFGPIRLDAAVPLNKRKRDPNFRIYLSIGQTF